MITSSSRGPLAFELAPPFPAFLQFPDVDRDVLSAECAGPWEDLGPRDRLAAAWPDFLKALLTPDAPC